MRGKGKLKQDINAYKLALQVRGRKKDWDMVEPMIPEMHINPTNRGQRVRSSHVIENRASRHFAKQRRLVGKQRDRELE